MNVRNIPIKALVVSDLNTRKDLASGEEDGRIAHLADSIRRHGLLNPLTVRPRKDGRFEIISGQRRYLACKSLDLKEIPCLVKDIDDDADATVLSLVENIHRADMNPMDKAVALKKLQGKYGSYSQVAEATAWSESTIRKYLHLLELPKELQNTLSTIEGPAKVSAMSRLAQTFQGEEAIEAYDRIAGFKQTIQEEILKQSGGDLAKLGELVEQAHEGAFNSRRCGGSYGCELIRDMVEGDMTQVEFCSLVEQASESVGAEITKAQMRVASRAFWKAFCK